MHERAVMESLIAKVLEMAKSGPASATARADGVRVVAVRVWLGALSQFTPAHFCSDFVDASRGTAAAGAKVQAELSMDPSAPQADGVVLKDVEVECADWSR